MQCDKSATGAYHAYTPMKWNINHHLALPVSLNSCASSWKWQLATQTRQNTVPGHKAKQWGKSMKESRGNAISTLHNCQIPPKCWWNQP